MKLEGNTEHLFLRTMVEVPGNTWLACFGYISVPGIWSTLVQIDCVASLGTAERLKPTEITWTEKDFWGVGVGYSPEVLLGRQNTSGWPYMCQLLATWTLSTNLFQSDCFWLQITTKNSNELQQWGNVSCHTTKNPAVDQASGEIRAAAQERHAGARFSPSLPSVFLRVSFVLSLVLLLVTRWLQQFWILHPDNTLSLLKYQKAFTPASPLPRPHTHTVEVCCVSLTRAE